MKTESELRLDGVRTLIRTLGLVDAERFVAAASRDRCDYTEWRERGLPQLSLNALAAAAHRFSRTLK